MNDDYLENKIGEMDDDDDELMLVDEGELSSRMEICRMNNGGPMSPRDRMEQEKRLRREIANSNERRRMQSINAGFQTLKALLPRRDGEKMSKASILQQTSDFLTQLQHEKLQLAQKIAQYKIVLEAGGLKTPVLQDNLSSGQNNDVTNGESTINPADSSGPPKKRRRFEQNCSDSSDEGVGMMSDLEPRVPKVKVYSTMMVQTDDLSTSPAVDVEQDKLWEIEMLQRQLIEMRLALDRERRMRLMFETQLRNAEINRLQSLTRLSGVSLLEFPSTFHSTVSSPLMSSVGSSLLVPQPLDSTVTPANHPPSPQPKVQSPGLLSPSTIPKFPSFGSTTQSVVSACPSASTTPFTSSTPFAPAAGASPFYHSNSSKQSLEAIVEAIRHLEGDQLFVDVDCRSNLQTQSMLHRYQQNDSGISSPVSERPYHLPSGTDVANAVLQTFYQQTRPPAGSS